MYGRTKLIGEWFVERVVEDSYIVRSSWLFGEGGKNFVETILSRAQRGEVLNVVDDQAGSPTYTKDLASALGRLIQDGAFGVYHVTNSGQCTWFEFAVRVLESADFSGCVVNRTVSGRLGRAARRPAYSVLDNRVYDRLTEAPLRNWEEALKDYVKGRNGG
jgi:dTDP-4-dehydrorhamnose reductase